MTFKNSFIHRHVTMLAVCAALMTALFNVNSAFADAASDEEKRLEKGLLYPLLLNGICEDYLTGFNDRAKKSFVNWRKQYEPAITKAMKTMADDSNVASALAREKEKIRLEAKTEANPDNIPIADQCRMQAIRMESWIPPNDARFSTPKQTGELYVDSLGKGDRLMAQHCLGENAIFVALHLEKVTKDELVNSAKNIVSVVVPAPQKGEKKVEGYLLTKGGRAPVVFELEKGNWRIINVW